MGVRGRHLALGSAPSLSDETNTFCLPNTTSTPHPTSYGILSLLPFPFFSFQLDWQFGSLARLPGACSGELWTPP